MRHRRATQTWRIRIESKWKEINPFVTSGKKVMLFEMDFVFNQHRLSVTEKAVKGEMEGSAAGSGHSVKQCQGTASRILSQSMQEPKGLLQFQPFRER